MWPPLGWLEGLPKPLMGWPRATPCVVRGVLQATSKPYGWLRATPYGLGVAKGDVVKLCVLIEINGSYQILTIEVLLAFPLTERVKKFSATPYGLGVARGDVVKLCVLIEINGCYQIVTIEVLLAFPLTEGVKI
jgi:hypothetical protein